MIVHKSLIAILCAVFLFACKTEKERESQKLQSDMQTYFKVNLMDSTSSLDSFRLVKIDTINQRMLLSEQSSVLGSQLDNLIELYKLSNEGLSNSVSQMRLYRILGSNDLVEIEKKDFDKEKEKGELVRSEIDTLMSIIKTIDGKTQNADTIRPIGYEAKCFYQLRLKDKSVKRDTTFILLNTNKDIVKRGDFLNLPYKVDFDKFR